MIKDAKIIEIHNSILGGNTVINATREAGISLPSYYQKIKKLGLETKKEIIKKKRKKEGAQSIKDMHDLAELLSLNFQEVHKYVNLKKSTFDNINRMKYLKNNSPVKFKEAILITILNYYKINDIKLFEILSTTKS